MSITDEGQSERVTAQIVTGNYFDVLGVRPALGRFFLPDEDRTESTHPVIVISHGLWRRSFAADPAVLGRMVSLNNYRYTVVGITPSEFTGTTRGTINDVYIPIMMRAQAMPEGCPLKNANCGWLRLIGRLKPGATRDQAQASLASLTQLGGKPTQGKPGKPGEPNRILLSSGQHGFTNRVQITPHACDPSPSPDGKWLLCPATMTIVSSNGKETRTLGKQSVVTGAWSRDSRSVFVLSAAEPQELLEIDITTSRPKVISTFPRALDVRGPFGGPTRMALSPDGDSLYTTVREMEGDIWILEGFTPPRSFWERLWP